MLKHFLKIAFRRLLVDKTFSLINLVGLVIGIASVFLLSKYIGFHLTADDFQEQSDHIFAVHQTLTGEEGTGDYSETTFIEVAPIAADQFPEVSAMSRYITTAETQVTAMGSNNQPVRFNENNIVEVDPDFTRMFSLRFLQGDPNTSLNEPKSVVLTESFAQKYFGEKSAMGQSLTITRAWGSKEILKITGIIEDYPPNSRFQFDCLQSLAGKEFDESEQGWTYPNVKSYLLLADHVEPQTLSEKLNTTINKVEQLRSEKQQVDFQLVAFTEEEGLTNNHKLLVLGGVVLLLITWINYTNLTGAKSLIRGKEFGVRRVLGSNRAMLIKQFLYEALAIYTIVLVAVGVLVYAIYPALFDLFGGELLPILEFETPINLAFVSFLLVGAFTSSIYPSLSVYKWSVTGLLKSNRAGNPGSRSFQNYLVIFQFTISLIMIIGTSIIYQQMQFIQNHEIGFAKDQMLIIKAPKDQWEGKRERMSSFKNELKQMSSTEAVASSSTVPLWWPGAPTDFRVVDGQQVVRPVLLRVDEGYFNCYDLDLLAGENFRPGQPWANRKKVLINELTARQMGFINPEEALGQRIINEVSQDESRIIGVVKNYHHESLRNGIKPQVFQHNPFFGLVSVKLNLGEEADFSMLTGTIDRIEDLWQQMYPEQAFDYYFLDARFNNVYAGERQFQQVFITFTVISVVVTFLGIFGLSLFISIKKRKEIGVKRVLGARPGQIVMLFWQQFTNKAALSTMIGVPVAYYLLSIWLANFSYRTTIGWYTLLIACLVQLLLIIISLSFESLKMAKANPLDMIREE